MTEKYYQLGTYTVDQWNEIYKLLTSETQISNIPNRCVNCYDDKPHSPTRGTFLLTDQEAEQLKTNPSIKFINEDYSKYPEIYKAPSDEIQATSPNLISRYSGSVKVYREFSVSNTLPISPDNTDVNRTGYQLLRPMQKLDPWVDGSLADNAVITSQVNQYGTGKDVDVIVGDDGMWFGHPEFQNNTTGEKPTDYVGGNVLPGNGTCDLLDLVLDAPYYLDPDWFNADASNRLTTRWDGTIVPIEQVARDWWSDTSQRSSKFASVGTVVVTDLYTRAYNNGSNTIQSSVGNHGTPCCALTYGRTQGWAYNSNKWALNVYNINGSDIEQYFDLMKIFHQLKPINPKYGTKNPTVSSNSWGYRASKSGSFYHFRTDGAVAYGGSSDEPTFISHMGLTGDGGRWKSEMKTNSFTTALDECIQSGVIFVGAAGNSNQKQVSSDHPDFNNYISINSTDTLEESSFFEFGINTTGSTNRRGFPQQGGMFDDPETGKRIYPVINIGALDDDFVNSKEGKVNYSDRGNEIDFYMPADGTLAANRGYISEGIYPDTYPGFTADSGSGSGVPEDCAFSGTSAACPVAAGFLATIVEYNREWTYADVRDWIQSLDAQSPTVFYIGNESTSASDVNWTDYNSLEGGAARVGYQANITISSFPLVFKRGSFKNNIGLKNIIFKYNTNNNN